MELWIRSQDKTALIKSEDIRLYYMKANDPDNETEIWLKDRDVPVAVYESKKRALEVLDEIQYILRPKGFVRFNEQLSEEEIEKKKIEYFKNMYVDNAKLELIKMPSIWVYEMPKE